VGADDHRLMVDRLELVDIGHGRLEVEITGRGEPVVVIQTALTCDELRPVSQHLTRSGGYRVLHYHRRGYAGSGELHVAPSLSADAADAAALIDVLGAGPAHVVGVSYSAAVALVLASSSPELVHTLSVVEPPPAGTPGAEEFRHANAGLLSSYEERGAQAALEEFMTMLVGADWRGTSERDAPGSVEAMERDAPSFFTGDVPALRSWRLSAEEAARIRCPTLYVGGSDSAPWFTEMRTRLLSLLPHADEATVEGAGHLLASTHPEQLAGLLVDHFRRRPTAPLP
jgi:pimeloyl-ACP methyl ester carboxylesterase